MSAILITGATGFLGCHLLDALRMRLPGSRRIALVRRASAWSRLPRARELGPVELVEGELLDPKPWSRSPALSGVRHVFHLAGIVKHSRWGTSEMETVNVDGTVAATRLAARLGARLVLLSSSGTVGCFHRAGMFADEDSPYAESIVGRWPYYRTKIRAEQAARRLASQLGVELVVVRPPVLLGPDDHRFRSTNHVVRVLLEQFPFIPSGGMDFCDVRDVAKALVTLVTLPRPRPVYHLPGTATTLEEFFRMCHEVSGAPLPRRRAPAWATLGLSRVATGLELLRPGTALHGLPDPVVLEMASHFWEVRSLHARQELAYVSRLPRQTLVDTVTWLRANHPSLRAPTPLPI